MKGGFRTRSRALLNRMSTSHVRTGRVARGADKNDGFTIIEVMIVLAVTGALFISAAVMISGRTAKTQFQQSINQLTGVIRQQINDVSSGYYPNNNNFTCTATGADINITAGTNKQGTNKGCIFLGKALYFGVANTDPQQIASFPIAALQRDANGDEVTSMAAAKPAVIYPAAPHPNAPNGSDTIALQYGLTVSKMYYGSEANPIRAVAFITSLGSYNGTELVSGSSQVRMVPITGTTANQTLGGAATQINANLVGSNGNSGAGGVSICFDSGTTNQSGLVTIGGGQGQQLSVTLSIKGNKGC